MAHGKARVEFLLSVIGVLSLSLTAEVLQGKRCQDSLLSGGSRWVRAKMSGGRGRPWWIFFGFYKTKTHFAIRQCKLHRATCHRFDTIPACNRQTDGIAVTSTALAKWRVVKNRYRMKIWRKSWNFVGCHKGFGIYSWYIPFWWKIVQRIQRTPMNCKVWQ